MTPGGFHSKGPDPKGVARSKSIMDRPKECTCLRSSREKYAAIIARDEDCPVHGKRSSK